MATPETPLLGPALDERAIAARGWRPCWRARRAGRSTAAISASSGSGALGLEPAVGQRHLRAALPPCAGPSPCRRDLPVGVALAHPHQGLSVLVHLESPSGHRCSPPAGKSPEGSEGAVDSRRRAYPLLAPICRSPTGSNTAITPWLQYADQPLDPICRSRNGSNVPIGDTEKIADAGVDHVDFGETASEFER